MEASGIAGEIVPGDESAEFGTGGMLRKGEKGNGTAASTAGVVQSCWT